ncbi:MAG: PQQ-dependent sugar dehydrogenase [Pseudomonadota bacterium]
MSRLKIVLSIGVVLAIGGAGVVWYVMQYAGFDIYVPLYADNCGGCHGTDMQGTPLGVALVDVPLSRGDSVAAIADSIRHAHASVGAPLFSSTLSDEQIKGLAIFVGERRMGQRFAEFQYDREVTLPDGLRTSDSHSFYVESVVEGLSPLTFSIEPMPDGSLLLTEKERGLSIIDPQGQQSPLIQGTPATGGSVDILGIQYGNGWLLDVALHPEYAANGWVYLHYTDLCGERCDGLLEASMNRLDRGRIVDGRWVDVETIWQAPLAFYSSTPDTGAGGRIAFDDSGHVFLSVGIKSADEGGEADISPQDLASPYGKIHRVNDDGSIPADNPFALATDVRRSVWTFGHRSPQGLEWHPERQRVWDSEMGPRGGDELNELLPGHNYGWPFHSQGLEYSGASVARYQLAHEEFDLQQVEQTLVDFTPSPAISSFAFYLGDQFPRWQGDVLIGSLKGNKLFRLVFDGDKLLHKETLLQDLARIRDVEVGYDGLVYLLLENEAGSRIVRLVPGGDDEVAVR